MSIIIPALLVESEEQFKQQFKLIENDCDLVQVDVLDNTLFPNVSWFDQTKVETLSPKIEIELHLMVENPLPIIEAWQKHIPTLRRAIVSAEMHRPLGSVVSYIKDILKLEVGVAINPETPLKEIEEVIHQIDVLMIIGIHPGSQGQLFEGDYIFDKIHEAKHHRPNLIIEVDGGITEELIPKLIESGVERLVVGSLIFKNTDPTNKLKQLNNVLS